MDPPPAPPLSTSQPPPQPTLQPQQQQPSPTTLPTTTTTAPTSVTNYPDSLDSSPRSRATDFDDPFPVPPSKLRLMCSYGGHIVPRPHDKSLCYVGGDTRIIVIDRTSTTLPDLLNRLSKTLLNNKPFTLKYQLPHEDLDSLITVTTDEDLDNMIDEYDRLGNSVANKPSRIRLFLFPTKPEGTHSIGPMIDGSNRSEDWFLNALNGAAELQRGFSDPASVNCLLGLDEAAAAANRDFGNFDYMSGQEGGGNGGGGGGGVKGIAEEKKVSGPQDVQSVPDSPIIETSSSFGSTSSSPSLANLPPIRVHVEENVRGQEQRVVGIEEQFAQIGMGMGVGVGVGVQKQMDEGFVVLSAPPNAGIVTGVPAMVSGGGEFANRVYSDDERSDHGGYRKQQQQQQVVTIQQQQMGQGVGGGFMSSSQFQQKQLSTELPSPDSVSSDSSLSSAISRQKTVIYQHDPNGQMISSGSNRFPTNMIDPNSRVQAQQVSDPGYSLHPQYDQQQQLLQQHQLQLQQQQLHQLLVQQQQQQSQTQPQNQQQYIPAGAHYVQHHPSGAMPMPSYYPIYPPQQQQHHPHQYPLYYVPAGQTQGYNLPLQQQVNMGEAPSSISSNHPQNPPNPTIITSSSTYNPARNVPPPKSDMAQAVYRTTTAAAPQLVQVPSSQQQPQSLSQSHTQSQSQSQSQSQPQQQQQFVGYPQTLHPSQSVAPNLAGGGGGYGYEYADPSLSPSIYYTQPLPPNLATQYPGVASSGPTMVMSDGSSQIPNDNTKQQVRSSQPL